MLFSLNISAQEEQEIIEHMGDRYVINVDALKPDKEMTLMDVLQICPELLSDDGKLLSSDYEIRMDNVVLMMDYETLMVGLKASEISTVEIYLYTSVSTGGGGRTGTIDIYLKEQEDGKTPGKVQLEGSTRGNGKGYVDVITRSGNVTFRGYALTNLKHAKGTLEDGEWFSTRQGLENIHLNVDWNISDRDNLKIKLFQYFQDGYQKVDVAQKPFLRVSELNRYWGIVGSYTHTFNDKGATLLTECGVDYNNSKTSEIHQCDNFTYFFAETNIPCLNNDLNILAGWEIDYYNMWAKDFDRCQMMYNDLYLQLDYTKGPWVLALGDRLRMVNYWHRTYNTVDASLWKHNRTQNSYLASVGYKTGGHFLQGVFSSDYNTPLIYSFYLFDEDLSRRTYNTHISTNMVYNAEARYTYQQGDFVLNGNFLHSWTTKSLLADERYTGVKTSVTWRKGPFRLTAGADYFHGYVNGHDAGSDIERHDNFFNIRLLPTLLLDHGLRFSSKLLYRSRTNMLVETPAHFYASLKVSKDLGRHCTISADIHDILGAQKMTLLQVGSSYDYFAATFGFTYRF